MALQPVKELSTSVTLTSTQHSAPLVLSKPRKQLDEDVYLEKLEKIIQRDFFPDIPKLKAQAEYLDAVEKNDVEKIRLLQMKYSRRRTDQLETIKTPRDASPETFETPRANPSTDGDDVKIEESSVGDTPAREDVQSNCSTAAQLHLDQFLSLHTSEDNAAFEEIMEMTERRRRLKLHWMFTAEKDHNDQLLAHLEASMPSGTLALTDGTATSASTGPSQLASKADLLALRPSAPDNWTYVAKNAVMWVPDEAPLTAEEKLRRQKLSEREIQHKNTRLEVDPFSASAQQESMSKALGVSATMNKGRVDIYGRDLFGGGRQTQSFSAVATPSPMPGVNESPIMTWGEIEGTPFRLDAGDLPVPKTPGPSFKIPDVPMRDCLALNLAEEASKKHRQRKQKAMELVASHKFTSPSPKSASKLDRLAELSPAARRLATSKLGIRLSTDRALKASYTPSPKRAKGESTPVLGGTPGGKTPQPTSVRSSMPESLTDDLLRIPEKKSGAKRPSAADFF